MTLDNWMAELDYSAVQIAFIMAVYFTAAFSKGITGLGFSTLCIAPLALVLGLKSALPLLIIPSLSSNLMVMWTAGHFGETLKSYWPMYLASIPGVTIGIILLAWIDPLLSAAALGIVLLVYCGFAFKDPDYRIPMRLQRPLLAPTGFTTGLINGLTGSQVMPVMPYFLSLQLDPNRFVQAVNCSFTIASFVMIAGLSKLGLFTIQSTVFSTIGIVFVWIGIQVGTRVRNRLSPAAFRTLVLLVLALLGITLVGRPLVG